MATNTSDFFTFSKTAGTAKNLQKPTDGGDNNLWGGYINVDLDTIVGAVNATSDLIADANQNELVDFTATGSAVNHVGITNAATGNGPTIEAKGDDTNIDLNVSGKGTGKLATTSPKITTGINDSNDNELIKVTATGSAVNEITVANAATGNGPTLSATGDDTNIDLNIAGKGTGEIEISSNIAFSNDTDAKVKLPSGGGIYESDGSTEILTESSGTVSLKNTTINSTNIFPLGNIKKIYSKTFTGDLSANSTTKVIDTTNQITIPSVSNGDFLYITAIGGQGMVSTSGVGSNVRCSITAGGLTFRGVDFYSNPAVNVPIAIARLVTISSDASNYVVARSVEGSSSSGNVFWASGSFNPVSLTVFHIGSGAISDVSNT